MVSLMTALYFGVPRGARPGERQAAREPGAARHQPPARPPRPPLPDDAARVRRPAVLPEPDEGPRPGRLLAPARVGLGATAPIWGALAHRYVAGHFDVPRGGRQIALIGDAELDEGACWEAIADPMVARLGEVMWVVDLNRQSLDRVVPDIAAGRLAAMFEAAGWHTRDGQVRPAARSSAPTCARASTRCPTRSTSGCCAPTRRSCASAIEVDVDDLDDAELLATFRDLGGHDLAGLIDAYRQADAVRDRPSVVFAYTIKGWSLPTEGHPANHSALLNRAQYRELAAKLGEDADDPFAPFEPGSPEAELCAADRPAAQARRDPRRPRARRSRPTSAASTPATASTQQAFGRFFVDLVARGARRRRAASSRSRPTSAPRTNLGGWINKAGHLERRRPHRLVRRRHRHAGALARARPRPPHRARASPRSTSSACSASSARPGRATASRCCRSARSTTRSSSRALEPWSFGIYARRPVDPRRHAERRHARPGGRRAPVGDHAQRSGSSSRAASPTSPRSARTSSGASCTRSSQLGRPAARSAYFRLSTRPIDQALHTRHARGGARGRLPAARARGAGAWRSP